MNISHLQLWKNSPRLVLGDSNETSWMKLLDCLPQTRGKKPQNICLFNMFFKNEQLLQAKDDNIWSKDEKDQKILLS